MKSRYAVVDADEFAYAGECNIRELLKGLSLSVSGFSRVTVTWIVLR